MQYPWVGVPCALLDANLGPFGNQMNALPWAIFLALISDVQVSYQAGETVKRFRPQPFTKLT